MIEMPAGKVPSPTIYTLSTEHAASISGVPVLVDAAGNAYGPEDTLPNGETAKALVQRIERGEGALFDFCDGRARASAEGIEYKGEANLDPLDLLSQHPFVALFCK